MKKALLLLIVLAAGHAHAATPPEYNVHGYCKEVAASGGGSYMIEKSCRDMEAEAKNSISRMDIPQEIVKYCDQVAKAGSSNGSYTIFKGCVNMEIEAKNSLR